MKIFWIMIVCLLFGSPVFALTVADYRHVEDGTTISLQILPDNKIRGQIQNNFFGRYRQNGNKVEFYMLASTLMAGPEDKMQIEQGFLAFLNRVSEAKETGDTLILRDSNGAEVIFKRVQQ